jgi:hypothetical protein
VVSQAELEEELRHAYDDIAALKHRISALLSETDGVSAASSVVVR